MAEAPAVAAGSGSSSAHAEVDAMADYPKLQPAFTVRVVLDPGIMIGSVSVGTPLIIVPMVGGTLKSEPGFKPALDATFDGIGYDFITTDATGDHMRLDVRSHLRNKSDQTVLAFYYRGTVALTPGVKAVLSGAPEAKTTPYGDSFITASFTTGDPKYRELETGIFTGAGHFVVEEGKTIVEYKVSRVVSR